MQQMLTETVCLHKIAIRTGYGGEVKTVHIFFHLESQQSYAWVTSTYTSFEEGKKYNIVFSTTDEPNRIKNVRIVSLDRDEEAKSEQPDPKPDALDVLLGLENICYTLDKGLNMCYDIMKGGE